MKKDNYFFLYKDMQFKYTPSNDPLKADQLTSRTDSTVTIDQCYNVMTEILSALAFACDAEIVPEPGMSTCLNSTLLTYTGGFGAARRIPVQETMDEFYYVPLIRTEEHASLVRLYRQARSSNNIYHSILFYWHSLVYPSERDQNAEELIDNLWRSLPQSLEFKRAQIDRVLRMRLFRQGAEEIDSLGSYVRDGVRNSIAHIVRDRANAQNLTLDLLSELRHLSDIRDVLRYFARYRLEGEWNLKESSDVDTFRYFNPEQ